MLYFITLSIIANQANFKEALNEFRNLQSEINPLNNFPKLNIKIAKVDTLLNSIFFKNNQDHFMAFYLKKIKHDLNILNNMSKQEKEEFSIIYKDYFNYLFFEFKNDQIKSGFSNILKMENSITKTFGEFSYIHLVMENYKLLSLLEFKKQYSFKKYILQRYNAYKNSDWKNNPELSFFLIMLCGDCENSENYDEMIEHATKLADIIKINYTKGDISNLDSQGFLLLAYTKTKDFKNAQKVFNEIDKNLFSSIERDSSKVFYRIHYSSFDLFTNLGMKKEAINSQELKLQAMGFFMKNDDAKIILEAKILCDLYIGENELSKAKKIESRFKLNSLAK